MQLRVKLYLVGFLLFCAGCDDRALPLRQVVERRARLAELDTVFTTRGTLIGFGTRIPFTTRSIRKLADGIDTVNAIVSDTAPIGRRIALRARVRNAALLGLDFGPIIVAVDDSTHTPAGPYSRSVPR
jgi:hypothetical protein